MQLLGFDFGVFILPHPDKADRGGEDGFFINNELNALSVADGVGSWYSRGIDPGIYARELVQLTESAIQAGLRDPVKALREAYDGNKRLVHPQPALP